jgi:hypothetical protein
MIFFVCFVAYLFAAMALDGVGYSIMGSFMRDMDWVHGEILVTKGVVIPILKPN